MVYLVVMRVCETISSVYGRDREGEVQLWVWLGGGGWIV
jgi:hypothetical protein